MTDKQQQLAEALADQDRRPVPEAAKRAAIAAAMAEFDLQQKNAGSRQGLLGRWRQRVKTTTQRLSTMNLFQQKWLYSGVAAASVAVLAVFVSYRQPLPTLPSASMPALPEQKVVTADNEMRAASGSQQPATQTVPVQPSDDGRSEADFLQPQAESAAPAAMEEVVVADAAAAPAKVLAKREAAERSQLVRMASPAVTGLMVEPEPVVTYQAQGRDEFEAYSDNPVKRVTEAPVSTFSIDVDTASYSFVRRQLNQGRLPQKDAVRAEELINYFDYDYPRPESSSEPFRTSVSVLDSPWRAGNKLLHIGIKGYELAGPKPRTNLVLLLDVSGSMDAPDKLPLVIQSMELLLSQLSPEDSVAIAVYAGAAGTVLPPTKAADKTKILQALNQLRAGGSTAGGEGIQLAYQLAAQNFDPQAVNRVVLATDGDFNVGISDVDELKGFVERERNKGIYLSVLGFGQGNYQDALMQALAQNGNGVAAYIDSLSEAQKVLVTESSRALFPIAQDVKIQVEFNPASVAEYRLVGYETRALAREDFNNDKVDAGDIGAGHSVTAIYEFTPVGGNTLMDASRYSQPPQAVGATNEYAFVKLRYKRPGEATSQLIEQPVPVAARTAVKPAEVNFAVAVAGFAQLLRGGQYTGQWSYDDAIALAQSSKGADPYGYRTELVQLIRRAKTAKSL